MPAVKSSSDFESIEFSSTFTISTSTKLIEKMNAHSNVKFQIRVVISEGLL